MNWLEEKEKMDAERREAHRNYMKTMSELHEVEEDLAELQRRIPELKNLAHKLRCKRDRLDKEFAEKFSNEEVNTKKDQLSKLQSQIEKLQRELDSLE